MALSASKWQPLDGRINMLINTRYCYEGKGLAKWSLWRECQGIICFQNKLTFENVENVNISEGVNAA